MRKPLLLLIALFMVGCDSTSNSTTATSVSSPFGAPEQSTNTPSPTPPAPDSGSTTTNPDATGTPRPSDIPNTPEVPTTPDIPGASDNTTAPITGFETDTSRLYNALLNGRSITSAESFWACSTQNQDGTFRMQLTGQSRDHSYDFINDRWGNTKIFIESDIDDYDAPERGQWSIDWRVESTDSIVLTSTQSEFSASNVRFFSIAFDQAQNRFSAIDSNGVGFACARVTVTTEPYCTYDDPYGGCVLAPIGIGTDAIEVERSFAPTLQLVNGSDRHLWYDFWQCSTDSGVEPFRFYFTGSTHFSSSRNNQQEVLSGVGYRYDYEGSSYRDNALSWTANALGSMSFTAESSTRSGRPLQSRSWTMFNITPSDNAQTFTASDSRGYDFSCARLPESGRVAVPNEVTGFDTYVDCFHAPTICPVNQL